MKNSYRSDENGRRRIAGDGIGATVEEELHKLAVPSEQDILQWDGLSTRAVLNEHFDHIQPPAVHSLSQGSVLLLLTWLVPGEQFNEVWNPVSMAVRSGVFLIDGDVQTDLPDAIQRSTS